jgi:hypothetical protein
MVGFGVLYLITVNFKLRSEINSDRIRTGVN